MTWCDYGPLLMGNPGLLVMFVTIILLATVAAGFVVGFEQGRKNK